MWNIAMRYSKLFGQLSLCFNVSVFDNIFGLLLCYFWTIVLFAKKLSAVNILICVIILGRFPWKMHRIYARWSSTRMRNLFSGLWRSTSKFANLPRNNHTFAVYCALPISISFSVGPIYTRVCLSSKSLVNELLGLRYPFVAWIVQGWLA